MAAAGAIVLSTLCGHFWMDGPLDMVTCLGGVTTILSIMNYSWDSTANEGGIIARERALSGQLINTARNSGHEGMSLLEKEVNNSPDKNGGESWNRRG